MSLYRDFKYEWLHWQVKNINLFGFFFFFLLCYLRMFFVHHQGSLIKFHFFHVCPSSSHCRLFLSAQSKSTDYGLCTGNMSLWFVLFRWTGGKWSFSFVPAVARLWRAPFAGSSFALLLSVAQHFGAAGSWRALSCVRAASSSRTCPSSTHTIPAAPPPSPRPNTAFLLSLAVTWHITNLFGLCFVFPPWGLLSVCPDVMHWTKHCLAVSSRHWCSTVMTTLVTLISESTVQPGKFFFLSCVFRTN